MYWTPQGNPNTSTNGEQSLSLWAYHTCWTYLGDELIGLCLEWINVLSSDQHLNLHNFATCQPIFKQKKTDMVP